MTEKTYEAADTVTVTVRVSDDEGKATDDTARLRVSGARESRPGRQRTTGERSADPGFRRRRHRAHVGAADACAAAGPEGSCCACGFPRQGPCGPAPRPAAASFARPARTATKGGVVTLTIRPARAGRAVLARHGRLRVRTVVSFTPIGGVTQTSKSLVTLHR